MPVLRWNAVSAAVGPVGAERALLSRETAVGRQRRLEAATKLVGEISKRVGNFPVSAVNYAAWLPAPQRNLVTDAMENLTADFKLPRNYFWTAILMRNGAAEALYHYGSHQPGVQVAIWEQFFMSVWYRRGDGDYVAALQKLEDGGMEPSRLAYSTYIAHAHDNDEDEMVLRLLERMKGTDMMVSSSDLTFGIGSLFRMGKAEEAKHLYRQITSPDVRHVTMMVNGLTDNRMAKEAIAVWKDARCLGVKMDAEAYHAVMRALLEQKFYKQVVEIFDVALMSDDVVMSEKLISKAMKALAFCGDAASTLALMRQLKSLGTTITPDHLNSVFKAFGVRKMFQSMRKFLQYTDKHKMRYNSETFNIFLDTYVNNGMYDEALRCREDIYRRRIAVNKRTEKLTDFAEECLIASQRDFIPLRIPASTRHGRVEPRVKSTEILQRNELDPNYPRSADVTPQPYRRKDALHRRGNRRHNRPVQRAQRSPPPRHDNRPHRERRPTPRFAPNFHH